MKVAYAYQNPDPEILRQSSSGGFFTRIASAVLERGGFARRVCFWKKLYSREESALFGVSSQV